MEYSSFHHHMISLQKQLQKNKGFTIIEFIVVLVIFSIMSGITLFNYNGYRAKIEQTNVAQDIGLTIRQAQVYGLSSSDRQIGDTVSDPNVIFGEQVLDITQDRSIRGVALLPSQKQIILFEDINRNRVYNPGVDRIVDQRTIVSPRIHFDVCLVQGVLQTGWNDCDETILAAESANDEYVTITFQRPYPDTTIRYRGAVNYSYVLVRVQASNADVQRYIEISPIGKISLKKGL